MKRLMFAMLALSALYAPDVFACAVCFGAPDDAQTKGMNAAILTMLGITYSLFAIMIGAAVFIWRRRRAMGESEGSAGPDGMEADRG